MAAAQSRTGTSMLAAASVGLAGAALTGLYAFATSRLLLHDFFPDAGISLDWIKMLGPGRREPAIGYLGLAFAASALYVVVLFVAWRRSGEVPRALFLAFPALFIAALILMYPPTAVDLFHYHADARTLWIYDRNPLVVPPAETSYPIGISWADQPSPYGPAWSLLTVVLAPLMVFGDHAVLTLVGFKLLAAASYVGCAALIYRLVAQTRPDAALFAFVLFAWNPFVLLRIVGNGHNDLTMMFFALVTLLYASRRNWTLVFPLLALSVLIKYTTALLAPPLLLYAWYQLAGSPLERVRAVAPGLGIAAVLTLGAYLPFWAGTSTFATAARQSEFMITSTPDLLSSLLWGRFGVAEGSELARRITMLAFLIAAVPLTWQARRGFNHLLIAGFTLLFLYLVIASAWFRPWYMLWPATLIALWPTRWGALIFLAITLPNLFPDIIEQYRADWGLHSNLQARGTPVAVQFLLPVATWIAAALATRGLDLGASRVVSPAPRPTAGGPEAAHTRPRG